MDILVGFAFFVTFAAVAVVTAGVLMLLAISIKPDFLQRTPKGYADGAARTPDRLR
ncbi:hypothetical protein [Rhodococcus sp. NPDC003348]